MKFSNHVFLVFYLLHYFFGYSQEKADLGNFKVTNETTPTFLLLEESPTSIYTPDNLRALLIHGLKNFGESMSIEITPYFFIKKPNRTFYNYIGIDKEETNGKILQHPFRGINTTNISFGYIDKEFGGIKGKRKTYSVGIRTTLLRFYNNTKEILKSADEIANSLSDSFIPIDVLASGDKERIQQYALKRKIIYDNFYKTLKPIFRLDGAMAYSSLFKNNMLSSEKASRFGIWLTAEGSLLLNEGGASTYNNYCNLLLTARYIKDGFNTDASSVFFNRYYRDFGGKIEFEFEGFAFAYEYIYRDASIKSERSVGTIRYSLSKDVTITGGFGKDFSLNDNLLTIFGINWGFNLGDKNLNLTSDEVK